MIQWELIWVQWWGWGESSLFCLWMSNCSDDVLKSCLSSSELLLQLCQISVHRNFTGVFLGSVFHFIDLRLSLWQDHSVWISAAPWWRLRIWEMKFSHSVLCQNCFSHSSSFAFLYDFRISLLIFQKKKPCDDFNRNCFKPRDQFEENWLFSDCRGVQSMQTRSLYLLGLWLLSSAYCNFQHTDPKQVLLDLYLNI